MVVKLAWHYQYLIAGVVVQVESDSEACEEGMRKFLCLYEPVQNKEADLTFAVQTIDGGFEFVLHTEFESRSLWVSDDADEISAALEINLYSTLVQFLDAKNIVSIHSAVLNFNGRAIMFAGASGSGKSSLCTAGLLDGAAYLSDEFALLDEHGFVHPFPRPMQWEHPTHPAFNREEVESSGLIKSDYFDFPAASGETARCHLWYPQNIQRQPLPLSYIVLHQYDATLDKPMLSSIPRYEALLELPQHLHVQAGMAKDLPMLNQRMDKQCQFYRLRFPQVFAAWKLLEAKVF